MKRLILVFTIIFMLCFAGAVFGAGSSFKVTGDSLVRLATTGGLNFRVLTLAFTADDSAATIPSLTINSTGWTDGTNSGYFTYAVTGWKAYKLEIDCNHAGTEPTENSDITIKQHGVDLLDGNGTDSIDNTAERQIYFQSDGQPMPQPVVDSLTVAISDNSENSATGTLYLIMTP